jgi:GTPase Era involved in 16S rRNA processing
LAVKQIKNRHQYVVIGVTKAGKSTLLNKIIGENILISNEMRATATRWAVNFHNEEGYVLEIKK